MRRSVVFPHPDGPTSTTMRGLGTVSVKSSTATTPSPKTFRIWEKIRSDMVGKGYGRGGKGAISKGLVGVNGEGRGDVDQGANEQDPYDQESGRPVFGIES